MVLLNIDGHGWSKNIDWINTDNRLMAKKLITSMVVRRKKSSADGSIQPFKNKNFSPMIDTLSQTSEIFN
jgi:hypothetical protein